MASASTASARPACSTVRLTGGDTSLTTAPGIAAALLGHGIVPLATLPATEGASTSGGVAVTFAFPVTGKEISVSGFVINLKAGEPADPGARRVRSPGLRTAHSFVQSRSRRLWRWRRFRVVLVT